MTKRIFPIKTEPACLLKWAWSAVYFNNGTSASCHRTYKYTIDPENFDQFHNLPEKIQAREKMLNGVWPGGGCGVCRRTEESGGISDRMIQHLQTDNKNLVPPELWNDPTATSVTPTILEVWFKNTCNMSCIYCGPHHSSKWQEENAKFGNEFVFYPTESGVGISQQNPHYEKMVADFWKYLESNENYKKIQRYHVLGGEPFLMDELDDSIEFWDTHPNPDLVFSVITNLNIPTKRFEQYVSKFEKLVLGNKIWKLQLTASIDGWGPELEYVRYGLDLDLWRKNFELLINKPWVILSINSTISALTIKTMPALLELINHWNTQQTAVAGRWKAEPILFSLGNSRTYDDPYNFGTAEFLDDFEKILSLMPTDNEEQKMSLATLEGIFTTMKNNPVNVEGINRLKDYLSALDQRRNTNWRVLFPWLDRDFSVQ